MNDTIRLSRRACLTGAGSAMLLRAGGLSAAPQADPRVAAILRKTIGIDTHNHVDVAIMPNVLPQPDIDIGGALKQTGLTAVCMASALDFQPMVTPHDGYDRFLAALASADAQLRRSGVRRALNAAQIRAAHAQRRPVVIQSIEGAQWLEGDVGRIAMGHARGLRHFGLFHDQDATPSLGDRNTEAPTHGGITPLGLEVIRACNRLGLVVDVAHGSAAVVEAAIRASATPVLFSHTGLNTWLDHDPEVAKRVYGKLVSKDLARAIASSGGLVGVWTHVALSPAQYGEHIRAMVDVCGVDHVCIGTDSKLTPALGVGGGPGTLPPGRHIGGQTRDIWPDMPFGFLHAVVTALLGAGFHEEEIGKICGGNYLRLFGTVAG